MGRTSTLVAAALIAAGAAVAPAPGAAQCRLCETRDTGPAAGDREGRIDLEVQTSLDFDKLILTGLGEGSATILPDGSREVSGIVAAISGRAMVGSALVRGEPGRAVRIELPMQIELYSVAGGRIAIESIVSDLPSSPRLDRNGTLAFRFGGRLTVKGDAEGEYRGDIPITVEYF